MKKKLIPTIQFISVFLIFILLFIAPTIFIPVSESLIAKINPEEMESFFPLLLLFAFYMSFSYWLLIKNSDQSKSAVFIKLAGATFILFPLMGFIESAFWLSSLNVVDNDEITRIFFRGVITFFLFSGYLSLLYNPNSSTNTASDFIQLPGFKSLAQRLLLIGIIYLFLYNLFGYVVAWQFEDTRIFYTGSSELKSFFTMLWVNFSDPKFIFVHLFRGILFGLSGYILYSMLNCSKYKAMLILALIYGGFGFQIILPNPIFPEMVRISHFIETTVSMVIFGIVVAYVFNYRSNRFLLDT